MLKIREIQIRNFRSIVNETIAVSDMNIFVGLNDAGKSNIIKALNLFFNGETEIGKSIDFMYDYSKLAPIRTNKAKEIIISLEIEVPSHYSDGGYITWKKVWRSDKKEPYTDIKKPKGSKDFSERSKVPTSLNRILYKYIPAIKSEEYFKHLLGELYSSASTQLSDGVISVPAQEYSAALKEFTKRISEIVKSKIGIDSILTLPENQMDIFRELAFGTKDNKSNDILLDYRGDGIKARHIPAILKFIEEINYQSSRGAIPYTTIWGYEEPENGIEMLKCFDLSNEFYAYKENIQLFISTHSPAFYVQSEKTGVKVFSVQKSLDSDETKVNDSIREKMIDEEIGLMPLVSPYIKEQAEKTMKYKSILKDNFLTDIDTIMVEGKTDKFYLENAIQIFSPELTNKLSNNNLRIITRDDSCGTTVLKDWTLAWCLAPFTRKLCVIFDNDTAANLAIKGINDNEIYKKCNHRPLIRRIEPCEYIIDLFRKNIHLPFSVEHLFPIKIWKLVKGYNLLEPKTFQEYSEMLKFNIPIDSAIYAKLEELIEDIDIRDTILTFKLKSANKSGFCETIKQYKSISPENLYSGFKPTIEFLERELG